MKTDNNNQASNGIREALNDRESKIEEHFGALRQELTDVVPSVRELIEKHPIGSAATFLGVGVMMGYLLSGGQRKGGESRESILSSAIVPAIETVKDHLDQLASSASESEHHPPVSSSATPADTTNRTGATVMHGNHSHSQQEKSMLNRLIELLVPIGVEMGLKALQKNGRADES